MAKKTSKNPQPKALRGKDFAANPQNINKKGRPKKLVSIVNAELREEGFEEVTESQLREAYMTIINLPFERIQAIAATDQHTDFPFVYKLVAKELISKAGRYMLSDMLDRAIGRPKNSVDMTTGGESFKQDLSALSDEELAQYMELKMKATLALKSKED